MFANLIHRNDFAVTRAMAPESVLGYGGMSQLEGVDATDPLDKADAADGQLLGLVMCVATATLVLALVSSMA
jgi:hypothetical protein